MRPPQFTPRFAVPVLRVVIGTLLTVALIAAGTGACSQTPVEEALVVTGPGVDELNRTTHVQQAVEAAAAAKAEADRIEAQRVADENARIERAKAQERRASRAAAPRITRQPSGNCTTGSANPGVADPCGCESSDVQGWSKNGKYYGKYQYGRSDWAANGGDPAKYGNATEAEQDAVAANTKYDAWPNC